MGRLSTTECTYLPTLYTVLTQSAALSVETPRTYMRESGSMDAILHAKSGR